MKRYRFLSALMALLMLFGAFSAILPVYAADDEASEEEEEKVIDYYTEKYAKPADKLATMELKVANYGYELYYQSETGEIAFKDTKTGQVIFSNPYDVGSSKASDDVKAELLSQIVIQYTENNTNKYMYSYKDAALSGQIKTKNVKNGLRVEYTLGKEEARQLVPRRIEKSRYETLIYEYIKDDPAAKKKFDAFYGDPKDPFDPSNTEKAIAQMNASFPITKEYALYILDPTIRTREINLLEEYIKFYCPHYTYEECAYDEELMEFESMAADPAIFKMALEYYIDEEGLQVKLHSNGIRFSESSYQLNFVQVLPYFGCGSTQYEGYTMIPDGSGTLLRYEEVNGEQITLSGKIYGQDYAYHTISGAHQQVMRLPIYGAVETYAGTDTITVTEEVEGYTDEETGEYVEPTTVEKKEKVKFSEDWGFVAIIEEGESMGYITTASGGSLHKYVSVYPTFYPRPKDSYNLAQSISVGSNTTWTVVSERKYTGSYTIKYIMLSDDVKAEENGVTDYYETSYVGMAKAYRDYLAKREVITPLEYDNDDIPLYIESFGAIKVQDTFLSFPVTVTREITTLDDIKTMYEGLAENGITNVDFKLSGFTNGGLWYSAPTQIKFVKQLGGNDGYKELEKYAEEKGIDIYTDFDFSYIRSTKWFDGIDLKDDAAKSIDNRYTRKRYYAPAYQSLDSTWGELVVSANSYKDIYEQFKEEAEKVGIKNISVSNFGSDLNTDFNEDNPITREDAKNIVTDVMADISETYGKVMTNAGNAYALPYADVILGVQLDSSLYTYANESIPLFGLVFHGYKSFSGTATNMAGDVNYEILKMIENGASPYFYLSYQNIADLKKSWPEYYSVSYDIWFEDLIEIYNEVNEAISDVKYATLEDHEFLTGERVPSEQEKAEADAEALKLQQELEKAEADKLAKEEREAIRNERLENDPIYDYVVEEEPEEEVTEGEGTSDEVAEGEETSEETTEGEETSDEVAEGEGTSDEVVEGEETSEETTEGEETSEEEATEEGAEEEGSEEGEGTSDEEEEVSKYFVDNGRIVKVTYSNGITFILNYNSYAVTVDGHVIEGLGYVKIVE